MAVLILRRLLAAALVMVAVAAVTFTMLHVLRPEAFFDRRPLLTQLVDYLGDVFLRLDFGRSREAPGRPVWDILRQGLPADMALLAGATAAGALGGLVGGTICAARPRSLAARAIEVLAVVAICAPVYWVGLMALLLFLPGIGFVEVPFGVRTGSYVPLLSDPLTWLESLLLPWLVLGAPLAGICVRMMRASTLEALEQDFMRTAQAKGLRRRTVLRRHAVPAGAAPMVALAGAATTITVTNLILVEQVFNIPGVFRLTTEAMSDGNFELLQGLVVAGAFLVVVGNLVADLVLAWLDPRSR